MPIGDELIVDRLLGQFKGNGIADTVVAVGYKKELIQDHLKDAVRYHEYDAFDSTNNLHTLLSMQEELNEELICSFADIIIDDSAIEKLASSKADITMMIDTAQVLESTMGVEIDGKKLLAVGSHVKENAVGNFIGMAKFSQKGAEVLREKMNEVQAGRENDYYTIAIDELARGGIYVECLDIAGTWWREIDTKEEYDEAVAYVTALSQS